jgi:hypothetical protein
MSSAEFFEDPSPEKIPRYATVLRLTMIENIHPIHLFAFMSGVMN